jgi:1-pyrroline-5-carboxylate dehydrogenase
LSQDGKVTYVSLMTDESIHGEYEEALRKVEGEFGRHHPMFIGDSQVFSDDGEFEDRSPIDSSIILGYFQKGNQEHARAAIAESKRAFPEWSGKDWRERVRIVRAVAERVDRLKFELAALITYEVGKNRYEALAEVGEAADMFRYYCDIYERNGGYVTPMGPGAPGERCWSVMRPHGVWAVISPFNFPFALAGGMTAAALLTGNTVVFKPTSESPFSGLRLYQLFIEAGVPPGAINYVTGPGGPFGETIVAHPDVDGIAFTGSRDVGMWLYRNFAARQPYPKPFIAEMGSKNPTIVTSRADLDKAVEGVTRAAFGYGGQKCSATSRVYVHSAVADEFLNRIRQRIEQITIGDPRKKEVFLGPLINEGAAAKFREACETALSSGGKVIVGGKIIDEHLMPKGHYVRPAIVTGLPKDHTLFKEELFVPLVSVATFTDLKEAIDEANNTEYGLTAGVFTEDPKEIEYFFQNIQFGVCYANRRGGATTGAWPGAQAFGGWKASGATGKGVGGPYYLLSFLREQARTIVEE